MMAKLEGSSSYRSKILGSHKELISAFARSRTQQMRFDFSPRHLYTHFADRVQKVVKNLTEIKRKVPYSAVSIRHSIPLRR